MKLHDPIFEKKLLEALRAAVTRHHGTGTRLGKEGVIPAIRRVINADAKQVVWTAMLLWALGVQDPHLRTPGCQNVVVGLWFFVGAGVIRDIVLRESFRTQDAQVLWTLPLPGERILWRALQRSLWQTWPTLLRACLACGWLLWTGQVRGWPLVGLAVANGVALWLVTLALAAMKVRLATLRTAWNKLLQLLYYSVQGVLAVFIAAAVYHWDRLPLQAWLEAAAPALLWLLPAGWITASMTGFVFGPAWIPAVASVVIVIMGFRRGMQWPKVAAGAYDSLPEQTAEDEEDEAEEAMELGNEGASDGQEETQGQTRATRGAITAEQVRAALEEPEAQALLAGGWIQRLVWRVLSKRDRAILPVLLRRPPAWSANWAMTLKGAAGILLLLWISPHLMALLGVNGALQEAIHAKLYLGACWGTAILLLVYALPIGGDVSDGVMLWPLGTQSVPFLCGFPVTSTDLLRVSWKIVSVRMVTGSLLALPVVWELAWQYEGHASAAMVAASVTARLLWLIFTARPLMVMYRMGTGMRRQRGRWLATFVYALSIAVLFLLWLGTGATVAAFGAADAGDASMALSKRLWVLALGLAPLLASLAMFWCFQWRLRHRGIDYGTSS